MSYIAKGIQRGGSTLSKLLFYGIYIKTQIMCFFTNFSYTLQCILFDYTLSGQMFLNTVKHTCTNCVINRLLIMNCTARSGLIYTNIEVM